MVFILAETVGSIHTPVYIKDVQIIVIVNGRKIFAQRIVLTVHYTCSSVGNGGVCDGLTTLVVDKGGSGECFTTIGQVAVTLVVATLVLYRVGFHSQLKSDAVFLAERPVIHQAVSYHCGRVVIEVGFQKTAEWQTGSFLFRAVCQYCTKLIATCLRNEE